VSNATLIADGVRTCWDSERIEKALQPFMNSYPICSPSPEMRFQELELNPQELSFLECIDGSRTLRQLLSDTSLPRVKACAVAYILLAAGVIEARQQAQQPEALQEHPTVPSPAKEENVRETLAAQLVSLQQRDAFGVLGLPAGANDDQVHQAYSDLATEYHPDRFRHLSAETRQMAQQIFDLISGAYQRVASVELRGLYRKESSDLIRIPGSAGGSAGGSVGGSALVAEQHRKDGLALMQQGRWGEARQLLNSAVQLCKDAGDLRALLAWSTYKSDPENASMVRLAIRELRKAVSLDPKQFQVYLFLGRIYAAMGKNILAEKQFEKALQCNPDCSEALDELKIQKERRPPRRYRF
jgi:tetratricopeptide (TPR) repeat protein